MARPSNCSRCWAYGFGHDGHCSDPNTAAIPEPISPEVDTGCNGPTSLVRQQLIDFIARGISDGLFGLATMDDTADALLAEFVMMKRIKDAEGGA